MQTDVDRAGERPPYFFQKLLKYILTLHNIYYIMMVLEYIIRDKEGKRDWLAEREAEEGLKNSLSDVRYSADHDHVR